MKFKLCTASLVSTVLFSAVLFSAAVACEPDAKVPPVKALNGVRPKTIDFKAAGWKSPLEIRTESEAAEHFSDEGLAALKKEVDFGQQIVLIFAWRGSGQDRLQYEVAESNPEQVTFTLKPGLTRDLRPHVRVFAVRSNVKWSTRRGRPGPLPARGKR